MKDQSPLIPSGSALEQLQRSKTKVLSTVFVIVAAHVLPITGLLLMQGCKPDAQVVSENGEQSEQASDQEGKPVGDNELYGEFVSKNESLSMPIKDAPGGASAPLREDPTSIAPDRAPDLDVDPSNDWVIKEQVTGVSDKASSAEKPQKGNPSESPTVAKGLVEHTIQSGDMLSTLAKKYRTTLNDLVEANPGINPRRLKVGYQLVVPQGTAVVLKENKAAPVAPGRVYVVKVGDSLSGIAKANGVTLSELRTANDIRTHIIHPGQQLSIPVKNVASGR
jgi:LysM repeat protein